MTTIAEALALALEHYNLGVALESQGQLEQAGACYRRALQLQPNFPGAHYNLGNVLQRQGRLEEAAACYRQALQGQADHAEAYNNLGVALQGMGQLDEAIACHQHAARLQPGNAGVHFNLGNALHDRGRTVEALVFYQRALQLKPDYVEAHYNLGNALQDQGRFDEAIACYRRALELRPDFAEATNNLGAALKNAGLLDEALATYRSAVAVRADSATSHSNLLYALHFHPATDARVLGEEHRRWYERHAASLAGLIQPHGNDPDPERRLRVAYVSPYLDRRPVGRFLLPLLEARDRRGFEILCYAAVAAADDVTGRLKDSTDRWRDVAGLSDERLAELIRADGVDIFVDLSAHTAGNRLLVFARKPAPVQVTYLAYCSTTGLPAIDYRLTDPYLDPPGRPPEFYAEESVWLPETYWCYRPLAEVAAAGPLPALTAGHVTFGSLNNVGKLSPPVLAAWRDLLRTTPGARLLLHAYPGGQRDRVRSFFAQGDVDPGRIDFVEFVGFAKLDEYFKLHDRIDIGLDAFPYAGGTTTCDALWMGVPVISLAGTLAVGRSGLSILSNVGLPELVANTPDEYVSLAAGLAGDLPRLAGLRAGLRERMLRSPLMDTPRFAGNVESAFRAMWQRWCATRPASQG